MFNERSGFKFRVQVFTITMNLCAHVCARSSSSLEECEGQVLFSVLKRSSEIL